ncbi:MAG: hypothetical protein D6718_11595 [Acidobacteria bacterium]|nr:MAG: hypothetical protein D6718_11595 [Acidobacteriota bacterium]
MEDDSGRVIVLFEILDRVRESWWTVVAAVCLGLAGGKLAMDRLPKVYEASTKFFVAPQQIPEEFVQSTVTEDLTLRIAALREAVLSRPYLERVIEIAFGGQPADEEARERLMNAIRANFRVEVNSFSISRGNSAVYFELTFRDSDPERAAKVVNTLADMYVEENSRFRTRRARETTETLEALAAQVAEQLRAKEREIAEFKAKHLYDSASQLEANLRMLEARQRDLTDTRQAIAAAEDRLRLLEQQKAAGVPGDVAENPQLARLAQLQHELDELRAKYLDSHPAVKAKQRQIEEFMEAMSSAGEGARTDPKRSLSANLDAQIEMQRREIARLREEERRIRNDIAEYRRRIEASPHTEQQLAELMKGYDVLQAQYRDYQAKIQAARGSEMVELSRKGEQFERIERAVPPTIPVQPRRLVVFPVALIAGFALFVGPIVVSQLWRPVVRSQAGLETIPLRRLASIPRIPTREARRRRLWRALANVALSALSAAALASAIALAG